MRRTGRLLVVSSRAAHSTRRVRVWPSAATSTSASSSGWRAPDASLGAHPPSMPSARVRIAASRAGAPLPSAWHAGWRCLGTEQAASRRLAMSVRTTPIPPGCRGATGGERQAGDGAGGGMSVAAASAVDAAAAPQPWRAPPPPTRRGGVGGRGRFARLSAGRERRSRGAARPATLDAAAGPARCATGAGKRPSGVEAGQELPPDATGRDALAARSHAGGRRRCSPARRVCGLGGTIRIASALHNRRAARPERRGRPRGA